jgi:hypothetical protein
MPIRELGFGIIGCGMISSWHADAKGSDKGTELLTTQSDKGTELLTTRQINYKPLLVDYKCQEQLELRVKVG